MKRKIILSCFSLALTSAALTPLYANACTRLLWNTDSHFVMVGRNEDYFSASAPTLVKTPRGIKRHGSVTSDINAVEWTSKYGSIAAFANNRFTMDGMNEAGLTARTLYFSQGDIDESSINNDKPILESDHWVSFLLDNFATVDEAVKGIDAVRLVSLKSGYSYVTPKHVSLADASGDSAVIEIQNGEVKIFHGKQYQAMTNSPNMQTQLTTAQNRAIDLNDGTFPNTQSATDRFQKAQFWVNHFPKIKSTDDINAAYGFMYSALGNISFVPGSTLPKEDQALANKLKKYTQEKDSYGVGTYFQSISDLTNKVYRFKSLLSPADIYVNLSEINWNAEKRVEVIPRIDRYAQKKFEGNITSRFQPIDINDVYLQDIIQ